MFRKTKIVCTIGPASNNPEILRQLMLEGMDVARFNFSHGDYETHKKNFDNICKIRNELGLPVATLLDTKGPEIRLGKFENDTPVQIFDGNEFILTTNEVIGTSSISSVSFKELPKDVCVGTNILIDDGAVELVVTKIKNEDITCKVIRGGTISNNKGVNVPGVMLSMPYISDKDMADLKFGAEMGFDFIAASFVRSSTDIILLKNLTKSLGWTTPRIIAKIENSDGVANIDDILKVSDGIMIARGDMGVEIPFEQIPAIQKELIQKGYNSGKQVITATQMLESMISHSRPTRAEITDVANAIYDGTSAIMLSGETAAGKYPVETVKTMALIAKSTENNINYKSRFNKRDVIADKDIANAISHASVTTAHDLDVNAIITVTKSGSTARMISKYRPITPIFGCTPDEIVLRQLNLSWGVLPILVEEKTNSDELLRHTIKCSLEKNLLKNGDIAVITAGLPLGITGKTNMMKVQKIGVDD